MLCLSDCEVHKTRHCRPKGQRRADGEARIEEQRQQRAGQGDAAEVDVEEFVAGQHVDPLQQAGKPRCPCPVHNYSDGSKNRCV